MIIYVLINYLNFDVVKNAMNEIVMKIMME